MYIYMYVCMYVCMYTLKKAEGQGGKAAKSVKYAAWEMKKLLIYFRQNSLLAAKVYVYVCERVSQ